MNNTPPPPPPFNTHLPDVPGLRLSTSGERQCLDGRSDQDVIDDVLVVADVMFVVFIVSALCKVILLCCSRMCDRGAAPRRDSVARLPQAPHPPPPQPGPQPRVTHRTPKRGKK